MRLLIVDDHAVVRAGFARLFAELTDCEMSYAATGPEALDRLRDFPADVIMLDLNMPGLSGFDLLRRLHAGRPAARILVATMYSDLSFVDQSFKSGAAGYITKSAPPAELLKAVTTVFRNARYIEPSIAQELAMRSLEHGAPGPRLSARDNDLIRLLGEGQSLGDIAKAMSLSYKTVANNCSRIKATLGLARTADLLRYAMQMSGPGGAG